MYLGSSRGGVRDWRQAGSRWAVTAGGSTTGAHKRRGRRGEISRSHERAASIPSRGTGRRRRQPVRGSARGADGRKRASRSAVSAAESRHPQSRWSATATACVGGLVMAVGCPLSSVICHLSSVIHRLPCAVCVCVCLSTSSQAARDSGGRRLCPRIAHRQAQHLSAGLQTRRLFGRRARQNSTSPRTRQPAPEMT